MVEGKPLNFFLSSTHDLASLSPTDLSHPQSQSSDGGAVLKARTRAEDSNPCRGVARTGERGWLLMGRA